MEVEGLEIWNTAGLKAFVKAAAQVPPTTQAEEIALVSLLKGKEAERSKAGQRLVESHQRLVIAMAAKYRGRGVSVEDLIQEGLLGLYDALPRFDARARFSTYAGWHVRNRLNLLVTNSAQAVRMPISASRKGKEKAALAESDNPRPAKRSRKGFVPERITMVALDAPMGEEGETTFGEQLVDPDWEAPLLAVEEQALPRLLSKALAGLNEREQDVLKARFGLSGDAEETLAQLADRYQLSRERIRQIEANALMKLREGPLAGALASLLST